MKVHLRKEGTQYQTVCGIKSAPFERRLFTDDWTDVTCKNCRKKMPKLVNMYDNRPTSEKQVLYTVGTRVKLADNPFLPKEMRGSDYTITNILTNPYTKWDYLVSKGGTSSGIGIKSSEIECALPMPSSEGSYIKMEEPPPELQTEPTLAEKIASILELKARTKELLESFTEDQREVVSSLAKLLEKYK